MRISEGSPPPIPTPEKQLAALADEVFERAHKQVSEGQMDVRADIELALEECQQIQDESRHEEKLKNARAMLLGMIDDLFDAGTISAGEAQEFYARLKLSPAERSRFRGPSA